MNVREATAADEQTLLDFTRELWAENWTRPWRPPEGSPQLFEGKLVLLAEDEDMPVGFAFGEFNAQGYAHVNIVYVVPERRRQGVTTALMREFAARAREAGIDHLTLDVATDNEVGREVWRRLGFTEWTRRLLVPIDRLEQHGAAGESYASLHVQSDDLEAVQAQVDKYLTRLRGSRRRGEGARHAAGPRCRRPRGRAAQRLGRGLRRPCRPRPQGARAARLGALERDSRRGLRAQRRRRRGRPLRALRARQRGRRVPVGAGALRAAPARRRGRPRREPDRRLQAHRRGAGAGARRRANGLAARRAAARG